MIMASQQRIIMRWRCCLYASSMKIAPHCYALIYTVAQKIWILFAPQMFFASKLYALAVIMVQDSCIRSSFGWFFAFLWHFLYVFCIYMPYHCCAIIIFCVISTNLCLRRTASDHLQEYLKLLAVVRWQDCPLWLVFNIWDCDAAILLKDCCAKVFYTKYGGVFEKNQPKNSLSKNPLRRSQSEFSAQKIENFRPFLSRFCLKLRVFCCDFKNFYG